MSTTSSKEPMAVLRHPMSPVLPVKMSRGHLKSSEVEEVDEVAEEVEEEDVAVMEEADMVTNRNTASSLAKREQD